MVFPLKIKLPLVYKLLLVNSVYSVLLDMDIAIMVILPKCDKIGVGTELSPLLMVEILSALLLVTH